MKTTIAVGLLILLASVATAEEDALATAGRAFSAGDYEKVVELCAAIGSESDDHARALYLGGEAHLQLTQYEKAKAAFRSVLALRPKAVPAMTGLGRALVGLDRADDAVEVLRQAVKADRHDLDAQHALGDALAAAGKPKEAAKILTKAFARDRKSALTCRSLVEVLVANDALAEAKTAAKQLVKSRPGQPMGYFLLGLVLDRDGEEKEAIAAYELAIEKDEKFLDAHKNLAILCHTANPLYRDRERTKKALKHYALYFELGGKDPELERSYLQMKGFLKSVAGD